MEKRVGSHVRDVDLHGGEELLTSAVIIGAFNEFMLKRASLSFAQFTKWGDGGTHPVQSLLGAQQIKQHFQQEGRELRWHSLVST